jgi:hypothetical protein
LLLQLWSELGLVASAKTYEPTVTSDRIILKISLLAIQDGINQNTENKTKNLPDSVRRRLAMDVEPPASIKVMLLHTVRVRLEFNSFDWRDGADLPIFSTSFKVFEDPSLPAEKRNVQVYGMFANLPHEPINQLSAPDWVLPASGDCSSTKMGNIQFISVFPDAPVSDRDTDLGEFDTLLDYAIRSLISSNPSRVAPGLKESNSGWATKLSEIAPAVFSPGYRNV